MDTLKQKIKDKAGQYKSSIISFRRHIHTFPELSKKEHQTAAFVEKQLGNIGVPCERMADTGVIGLIHGKTPGKTIALRADMDALPVTEANTHDFVSQNRGVMHACGHDAHTAVLLGAAQILQEFRAHFAGRIVLIFQPSEENLPGGAKELLEEGLFHKYKPAKIIGLHTDPELHSGTIGMKAGEYMASTDEIYLHVKGKGGHGAMPDKNTDTVLIASQILVSLQQVVSRESPPALPAVLSFGRFIADGQTNIIPDHVKIDGTFRTFDESWRVQAHQRIREIADYTARAHRGECEVLIKKGYPCLVNDEHFTAQVFQYAQGFLGREQVLELPVRMTAEDFAYYAQQIPACFFRLGIRNEAKGITANLHTSTFDIDEASLETGTGIMSWLAMESLGNESG
ncbi:MAG: M20 family metallopeptidase [Bacteroidales bacterium]